jgi:hypothetical protein
MFGHAVSRLRLWISAPGRVGRRHGVLDVGAGGEGEGMITPSQPVTDALLAVHGNKHPALVRVQAAIVRAALDRFYVSPGDIPEDICAKEDRQGVASNAWNGLRALEIIEPVPLNLVDESRKIFGGRIQNTNPSAKGRWVACYRLKSRGAAVAWLAKNAPACGGEVEVGETRELFPLMGRSLKFQDSSLK